MNPDTYLQEYYRKIAPFYDTIFHDCSEQEFLIMDQYLLKLCSHWIGNAEYIVEIGCGTGYWLKQIAQMTNNHITGVDISVTMLKVAREECGEYNNIDIVQGDIRNLDFIEDECVDFILCAWVLQYLTSLREFRKGFDELARITRTGGILLIAEDLPPTNPFFSHCLIEKDECGGTYFYEDRYEGMSLPVYRRLLNNKEMTHIIKEAGFEVSDYKEKISLGAYVACRR